MGCGVCEMMCPAEPAAIVVDARQTGRAHDGPARLDGSAAAARRRAAQARAGADYTRARAHAFTRARSSRKAGLRRAQAARAPSHRAKKKWLKRRWAVLIVVNLLFVVSYRFDVQLVEGALTGSRLLGFHLIDLNSALQVMLAHKHVIVNLLIGTATIGAGVAAARRPHLLLLGLPLPLPGGVGGEAAPVAGVEEDGEGPPAPPRPAHGALGDLRACSPTSPATPCTRRSRPPASSPGR